MCVRRASGKTNSAGCARIQKGKLLPYLIKFLVKIDASYIHGDDCDFDENLWLKNHLLYFENLSKWYKSGFEF